MTTRLNVGLVALVLAWLVGIYDAGAITADPVTKAFPSSLFITLLGVTALFAAAEANGTLERLARSAGGLAFGDSRMLGPIFFVMAALLAAVGPGAVPTVALLAPMAMAVGTRAGVSPFVVALLIANGANAGNLSPVSAVGVIANQKMSAAGLGGHEIKVMMANFTASLIVAAAGFVLFGGHRRQPMADVPAATAEAAHGWTWQNKLTIAAIAVWVISVVLLKWSLGLSALAVAALLIAVSAADEGATIKKMPWGVVLMVCGVSTLVELLNATGGMELFTSVLSRFSTAHTVNGVMAFVTGAISIYSSTSGVVLPAFLPLVPGLSAALPGASALGIAMSMNVAGHLVDVSPLSTIGALCMAGATGGDSRKLFTQLLAWGLSMAVVGALLCWALF
jgi:di/tricarboxylate transporter